MNYEQMMKQAQDEGRTKQISIELKRWDKEGETLIGKVIAINRKESDTFDSEYNQYMLETDFGHVATIFGASVDLLFTTVNPIGNVYAFEFKGKRKLEGGKQMNVFVVTSLTAKV